MTSFRKHFRSKTRSMDVAPDEIFLDSKNLPEFNTQQFEGRLEQTIPKRAAYYLAGFFIAVAILFGGRLGILQISKGEAYAKQSENNSLHRDPIFADRGIVLDRNGVELASNVQQENGDPFPHRKYIGAAGFGHLLGYVSYPSQDKAGFYWQSEFKGMAGVEKSFDDILKGENGLRIVETDVKGNVQSENITNPPQHGENITLSIDSRVQEELYKEIRQTAIDGSFVGGAGVIMDVHTGEILGIASYPEYDSNILSDGGDAAAIKGYLSDKRKTFLNRAIAGLYAPGSIVKPFVAFGALDTGVVTPSTQILSTGSISIPNPYNPKMDSVFKDWRVNGYTDIRHAIAVSSDVYFYEVGGGYKSQRGMGILNIEKYTSMFGLAAKTGIDLPGELEGVIPTPDWKEKTFPGTHWNVGDTYHTVIGQYGFQVTPLQMARGVAAIANGGTLFTPHILKDPAPTLASTTIDLNPSFFQIVCEGMRLTVTEGTAPGLQISGLSVASKTGTAQVNLTTHTVNSWNEAFFPYENPKYAIVVVMENGPDSNSGATHVVHMVLDWMHVYTPEYTSTN